MAHSKNYENVISLEQFRAVKEAEEEIKKQDEVKRLLGVTPKLWCTDASNATAQHLLITKVRAWGIEQGDVASTRAVNLAIKNNLLTYATLAGRDHFTLAEIGNMIDVILMAIEIKRDDNKPYPFVLNKEELMEGCMKFNKLHHGG